MGNSPGSPSKRAERKMAHRTDTGSAAYRPADLTASSPQPLNKLRRSQSAPVEVHKPPASPGQLMRMARFANNLDDTFSLLEGLYSQLETSGSSASLTRAELDQLADAMRSLCNMEAHRLQNDAGLGSLDMDVSAQFIGAEYALTGSSHQAIRQAILKDLKQTPVEINGKSLKLRRQSCLYLVNNIKPIVESYLEKINDWGFDVLEMREQGVTDNPLVVITMAAIASQGLTDGFIPNEIVLVEYLKVIEASYFENAYHNSWHAADVVQATNYGILTSAKDVKFPRLARFSAIIAAAVHDVGHLGVNNAFLITTSHPLALQYSDRSPLEMMHANKAFSLMLRPNCNVLQSFSNNDDRVAIRKIVISMVLSTDNANHSSLIESFTRMRVSDSMNLNENANEQQTLLNMLLHSMDVSNVARPWAVSRKWLELITIEFYAQGDSERSVGIAVTPIMDRKSTTPMSQLQTGFITFVVKPLFVELNNACMDVADPLRCIEENLSSWAAVSSGQSALSAVDTVLNYTRPPFIDEVEHDAAKHRPELWPEMSNLKSVITSTLSNVSTFSEASAEGDGFAEQPVGVPAQTARSPMAAAGASGLARGKLFPLGSFSKMDEIAEEEDAA